MDKLIDLHTHTVYSDGDLTPDELINLASSKNIETMSITDHDNVLAYQHITDKKGINLIPGVELSAQVDKGRMHILGYGIDTNNENLNKELNNLKESNIEYFLMIIDYLRKKGIVLADKDISLIINRIGDVGRTDIAKLLVDYGYAETVDDAFDKYLIEANDKLIKNKKMLSQEECINLIKDAGGIPILAHPISLKQEYIELKHTIETLKSMGLMGIELYHSNYTNKDIEMFKKIINEYKLLYSGGSDYHGKLTKPDIEIGTGKNKNLYIKQLSIVDYLKK